MSWVYVLGEASGEDIKIGHTSKRTVGERLRGVNGEQTTMSRYVMLAAVSSQKTGEDQARKHFQALARNDKGRRREYFVPDADIIEWVLWLRQQWWTAFDCHMPKEDAYAVHYSEWVPGEGRRSPRPPSDPNKLVQDHAQLSGPLAGTAWDWMPDMTATFQDYFTPPELVARALRAMGSIDLDAASHWIAQRRLHEAGVDVRDYFHVNRSAFDHSWNGNVWLNPPYGENERWLVRAEEMFEEGSMAQLCMLSPVYAFTTKVAASMMAKSSAMVLLTPTPKFYNPQDPSKDGTNLPHAIVYWGPNPQSFLVEFGDGVGIPFRLA